jgi:UPF0755 protein
VRFLRLLTAAVLCGIIAAGAVTFLLARRYAGFSGEVFVEIPKGASTRAIAARLASSGVIAQEWEFLLARALRSSSKLQAGEYRFAAPASVLDVYGRIARGDVFYYELAIPEGFNMFDVASAVEKLGFMSGREFLAAARDPSLIRDLDPAAPDLEGYLFPDTYRVTRHTTPHELCRTLTHRFRQEWDRLHAVADVHQTITLASLIEKEAASSEDRPLIAAVFRNRLKLGMKLDCDPTTVYASLREGRYSGTIHQSDLASNNPYNTYQHAGLPPGPIANPGHASIRAALNPADADYLYFVARPDGSGRHQFSKDIATHRAAATRYRRGAAR